VFDTIVDAALLDWRSAKKHSIPWAFIFSGPSAGSPTPIGSEVVSVTTGMCSINVRRWLRSAAFGFCCHARGLGVEHLGAQRRAQRDSSVQ
jgi:hypothetical protein